MLIDDNVSVDTHHDVEPALHGSVVPAEGGPRHPAAGLLDNLNPERARDGG